MKLPEVSVDYIKIPESINEKGEIRLTVNGMKYLFHFLFNVQEIYPKCLDYIDVRCSFTSSGKSWLIHMKSAKIQRIKVENNLRILAYGGTPVESIKIFGVEPLTGDEYSLLIVDEFR